MDDEPPTPPDLPAEFVTALNGYTPEKLQAIAHYTEALAEYKTREARLEEKRDDDDIDRQSDDVPDDVPTKATITIKEINDNRYYYWQWREGESVKSKYKGPVNPDE
ncbi:hypothetical protein [Halorubrum vacuolatum]|uniref:DUF6788 domain-containing protein n=1 Tax=Halorubrum vacuolatum TaxID=63740 RepID=A0A238YHM7_HALVU|nr:hypothetical protein [Halorubrum vacuolatum]SNR70298.1 hypothetical protein SAMN06264855_1435 [Halorubrum vacuolatum]